MRAVPVRSLEEEYRYVQFHPFPCTCGAERRKVVNHALQIRPTPVIVLTRLFGASIMRYLPFLRLYDVILVECPACDARAGYAFDIASVPHVQRGFRRRFLHRPRDVVMQHMGMVRECQERFRDGSLGDLEV